MNFEKNLDEKWQVSLLQHDHQGLKEAVILLDQEKANIQKNLRQFVAEYQKYIDEMDQWSGGINTKLTNVLEAMHPTRMEWRIAGIFTVKTWFSMNLFITYSYEYWPFRIDSFQN